MSFRGDNVTTLSELRAEKNITQIELARAVGVTQQTVSQWESGKAMPTIKTFERLAGVLNIAPAELSEIFKRQKKEEYDMLSNEEIFSVLKTKGRELSDWLKKNFNPHTVIIITSTGVKIVQDMAYVPAQDI